MGDFTMPSLGADMDQGTLLEWRVAVGDAVSKGDIVAVVDTEKSTVDIEVFETGIVEALLVEPGTEVPVGTPLARIRAEGEHGAPPAVSIPDEPETAETHRGVVTSPLVRRLAHERHVEVAKLEGSGAGHRITRSDVEQAAATAPPPPISTSGSVRLPGGSSPLARRRAAKLGIDPTTLHGSGPGGAVVARDVGEPAAPPASDTIAPRSGSDRQASVRQAIARLMTTANREIPHYHLSSTVDLRVAMTWLAHENVDRPASERILPAAMLLKATALAAVRHPELNGWWIDDTFQPADGVHLAVAVSLRGGGLITPVIHGAENNTVRETMDALRELVTRSRQASLRGSDLSGASITVTNLGDRGADSVLGVINPPQVALVGFGRVADRPVAVEGMVGVHPTVVATLSGDHRATDGMVGSRLLETVDELLQHPDRL